MLLLLLLLLIFGINPSHGAKNSTFTQNGYFYTGSS
jgi:hypothetical protein